MRDNVAFTQYSYRISECLFTLMPITDWMSKQQYILPPSLLVSYMASMGRRTNCSPSFTSHINMSALYYFETDVKN